MSATGLEALALFGPAFSLIARTDLHAAVDELVELLRVCQTTDDDAAAMLTTSHDRFLAATSKETRVRVEAS